MGAAVSSQKRTHAQQQQTHNPSSLISLSSLLNQLHASPISPLLDQALAVGHYALPSSVVSAVQTRVAGFGEEQEEDSSSAETSREGSIRQQEDSTYSSAASSATNSPEKSQGMGMSRPGRDSQGDETVDLPAAGETNRVYGQGEENGMGLMMDMGLEERPAFEGAVQEESAPREQDDGPSPASSSSRKVEVQRWFTVDDQPSPTMSDSNSNPPASSSAPSLHPFDPTFSPPSPLCGSSSSSNSISATSSPVSSLTSALSATRPPPTPPTPSPPRSLPQLPEGCVLIPFIAEEDAEEEDAEYWTRLPTFENGPGSPNWNWDAEPDTPNAPPSPRARSLSLPLPLKERPTAPSRARSSPNSSTLLAAGAAPNSRGRSASPSSRGREFSPCASSSSNTRQRSPSPPKEPTSTRRTRSGRPRRPKPPIVVDPWAPASPPDEKKKYMRSIGSALGSSSEEDDSSEEESDSEEEEGSEEHDSEEEDEEEDSRFVDLAHLRRVHYLSLSLQAPPSSSASSSRSNSPDGTTARRRQKRGSLYFAEQFRLYALGTANLKRTGEGYWRDVGRGGSWFDLE